MTVIDFPRPVIDLAFVRSLPPLVTMPVAAEVLGMTRQSATALARVGKLPVPVLGTGRSQRVARRDLEGFFLPAKQASGDADSCKCADRVAHLERLVADLAAAVAGPATVAERIRQELTQ